MLNVTPPTSWPRQAHSPTHNKLSAERQQLRHRPVGTVKLDDIIDLYFVLIAHSNSVFVNTGADGHTTRTIIHERRAYATVVWSASARRAAATCGGGAGCGASTSSTARVDFHRAAAHTSLDVDVDIT